jgi:2',3'-cyclic-nucleotide 2'-phosphodiesterase (5'-nucleotidase family)
VWNDVAIPDLEVEAMSRTSRTSLALLAALGLAAGAAVASAPVSAGPAVFRLQLLHASDLEGGVDAVDRAPNFAAIVDALEDVPGVDASLTVSAGDNVIPGPFFNAASDSTLRPTLTSVYNQLYGLTAPDAYTAIREGGGRVDYSIMNVIGFDASAVGNHEFDLGSEILNGNVRPDLQDPGIADDRWPGIQFPYLSANLDFSGDAFLSGTFTDELLTTASYATAPTATVATPKIAPYALYEAPGGEVIGLVGATTPILRTISSPTGTVPFAPESEDMPALAGILQRAVDAVVEGGANKVILLSHLQRIDLEEELSTLLDGVDVIVAGGSDTILANDDDPLQPGAEAADPYPLVTQSASDEPVAIVSTDGEYTYVGRLVVDFDSDGILVDEFGDPIDSHLDLDDALNGPIRTTIDQVEALWGTEAAAFAPGTKGALVEQLVGGVTAIVAVQDRNVFGETEVFIDGRRSEVRTQETWAGNLSADANIFVAQQVDPTVTISLKNGGGIRAEIGEVRNNGTETEFLPPQFNPVSGKLAGQVSQLDIANSLRFNNDLSIISVTAEGLVRLVEHGVAATAPGVTPGRFPQVGGFAFSFDPTLPPGDRVRSLVIGGGIEADVVMSGGELVGDPDRQFRMVTLSFLQATNGDGYPFSSIGAVTGVTVPGSVVLLRNNALLEAGAATFTDPGREQDAFAEYFATFHGIGEGTPFDEAETPPALDERIQNLAVRDDGLTVSGTGGNDRVVGTDGDDILVPGAGNDRVTGRAGSDRFVVGNGNDVVTDFDPSEDIVDFAGRMTESAWLKLTSNPKRAAVIQVPGGGNVVLQGVKIGELEVGVNVVF